MCFCVMQARCFGSLTASNFNADSCPSAAVAGALVFACDLARGQSRSLFRTTAVIPIGFGSECLIRHHFPGIRSHMDSCGKKNSTS